MAGSCAARGRELRQVRKEAAVSGYSRVPQGSLAGASATWAASGSRIEGKARPLFIFFASAIRVRYRQPRVACFCLRADPGPT